MSSFFKRILEGMERLVPKDDTRALEDELQFRTKIPARNYQTNNLMTSTKPSRNQPFSNELLDESKFYSAQSLNLVRYL